MSDNIRLIELLIILTMSAGIANAETTCIFDACIIYPMEDTYIDSDYPNDNFVGSSSIGVDKWIIDNNTKSEKMALLKFDLSSIPDTIINSIDSAYLTLYEDSYSSNVPTPHVTVFSYSNNSWNPITVTWNNLGGEHVEYISENAIPYAGKKYWWDVKKVIYNENRIITLILASTRKDSGSEYASFSSINSYNKSRIPMLFIGYNSTSSTCNASVDRIYPELKGYITDSADIIDDEYEQNITELAEKIDKNTTVKIGILTVDSLECDTIENYTYNTFKSNGIGNNGLLILVAKQERKYRFEVGHGLENIITSSIGDRIIGDKIIIPNFKNGDYGKGIYDSMIAIEGIITSDSYILSKYRINYIQFHGQIAEGVGPWTWNGRTFSALYYDIDNDMTTENLNIVNIAVDRSIPLNTLSYTTYKIPKTFKAVENGHNIGAQNYYLIRWRGKIYVAINGNASKLSRAFIQHNDSVKVMTIGNNWTFGNEWNLTIQTIDTKAISKQAQLVLSKKDVKLDEKIVNIGDTYVYKENVSDEASVPVFMTYIDDISTDNTTDVIKLKYTWAMSTSEIITISEGYKLGLMKVDVANNDYIQLSNDNIVNLTKGSTIWVIDNIRFRVADSDALRFYPIYSHLN